MPLSRSRLIVVILGLAAGSLGAVPFVVAPEGLAVAARMHAHRAAHTATTLPDGRVLVAGGFVEKGAAVGAELFDGASGRFLPLPPMRAVRHSHTATLLSDGRVLVAGGYGEGGVTLGSTELFDPRSGRFTPTGALVQARADHVAVALADGRVLVAGGLGPGWTFLASAEVYDPAVGRFRTVESMQVPREGHAAVRLADGRVLVVGGHAGRRAAMVVHASAETFDPRTGRFTRVGDLGVRRHKHDVVLLRDGRALVTGGADERDGDGVYDSAEFFDPGRDVFTPAPRLALPRYKHEGTSLLLADGRVLIAGGAERPEVFEPSSARFTAVAEPADMPGLFSAAALLPGGDVLITGGYGRGRGPATQAWRYRAAP